MESSAKNTSSSETELSEIFFIGLITVYTEFIYYYFYHGKAPLHEVDSPGFPD